MEELSILMQKYFKNKVDEKLKHNNDFCMNKLFKVAIDDKATTKMEKQNCSFETFEQLFSSKDAFKDFKSLLGEGSETKQFTEEQFVLCLKNHVSYYGPHISGARVLKLVLRDSNEGKRYKKLVQYLSVIYEDANTLFLAQFQDQQALLHLFTKLKMNINNLVFYHCVTDKYFSSNFKVSKFQYLETVLISSCHFQNRSLKSLFKVGCLIKRMEFQNTDLTSDARNISNKSPHLKQISFTNHPQILTNTYMKNYYQLCRQKYCITFYFRGTLFDDYIYLNYVAKLEMQKGIPLQILIYHKMERISHLWNQNYIPQKLISSLTKMIHFTPNR